jgi:hypothetical protein
MTSAPGQLSELFAGDAFRTLATAVANVRRNPQPMAALKHRYGIAFCRPSLPRCPSFAIDRGWRGSKMPQLAPRTGPINPRLHRRATGGKRLMLRAFGPL